VPNSELFTKTVTIHTNPVIPEPNPNDARKPRRAPRE
jgi:hypothetical protein